MERFASFKFDDGYLAGASKVAARLHPNPANFFIVTDFAIGVARRDDIDLFRGAKFGDLADWQEFVSLGHDVHSHSASHVNFRKIPPSQRMEEAKRSIALLRQVHEGPYAFGFPYNADAAIDFASVGYSAAGFLTTTSECSPCFNHLARLDHFHLRSWAVREPHLPAIRKWLGELPPSTWTVFALHSLDGEGHEPWSADGFARLVDIVRDTGLEIVSFREILSRPPAAIAKNEISPIGVA